MRLPGPLSIAALVTLVAGLASAAAVEAHPLSGTSVTITQHQNRIAVTIKMDADALLARLGAREPGSQTASLPDPADALRQLGPVLAAAVDLTLAGQRLPLTVTQVHVDGLRDAAVTLEAPLHSAGGALIWRMSIAAGSYALSTRSADGGETVQWVQGRAAGEPVPVTPVSRWSTAIRGVVLGFTHIVPKGADHILFVMGLALFGARGRQLVALVTAFTLAHSVTLALGLYGLVAWPAGLVEPLIAASVAYVGFETLAKPRPHAFRLAVVFLFGLLHGLGFASVLGDLIASPSTRIVTLASFNVGVELGQLTVLAAMFAVLGITAKVAARGAKYATRLASAAIGVTGVVWTVERLFGG